MILGPLGTPGTPGNHGTPGTLGNLGTPGTTDQEDQESKKNIKISKVSGPTHISDVVFTFLKLDLNLKIQKNEAEDANLFEDWEFGCKFIRNLNSSVN